MADCHVPLTIPEANAGRISAPVPSSLLKWPMVKKKTRSIGCVQTPPPFLQEKSRGGGGDLDTGYNEHRSEETKTQVA